ncbi:MAG: hypothetical protein RLZZ196_233 [Bacteroidota bacterium]|jgi:hypothetical protein
MVEDKLDNQGGKWDKYAVDDSGSKWDKYSVPDDDLKKKSTPVISSGTPSQLPSQPDFLKQGASLADNSFLKKISESAAQSVAQPSPKSKLPLEGFSQKQIDLLKKGVEKPAQKTSGGLMIPTNLPKEDGEDKDEWKLKNLVQNVFANFELAGTSLLADATTLAKDVYQAANPFAPNIPSTKTETEKAVPTPWELDPYGNVIRGLHGNQERMKGVIANNPLPNTFWGKAVSSVASFAPDIAVAGLFPGAPLFKGASFLAKTGNLLLNDFTRYSIVKGGLSGYGEARKEGKDIGEASLEGVKGAGKGLATGAELAVLGAGSNLATKSIMNKLENYGLGNMTTRQLVGLGNDVLAYGIVSPFSHAALEGRLATADEIANGTGVAALFRLKGALKDIKSNADLNKAIKETLEVKQGVAVSNFVDATPESIVEVYNSKGSADEFQLRALAAAKKARETTDLEKKAKYVAEASTLVRAANVKQVADMVINNKDGFAEFKASDLPDSAKKEFLQKAEEINKLLNPFEKAKTDLDNKIKESEDLFSQLSQQAEQSQDPNERAQLEAQAREAKDNAEKFRNELAEVKFNQNRPDVNAGKAPVMEGEVAPAEVKIGDSVQWTSQGTDQFTEPRKIKSISEDGKYAFVEGSDTGIPVAELSVTEVKPTEVKEEPLKENEYYHATDATEIIAPNEKGYKKREGANVVGEGIYFGKDKEHLTDRYGKNAIKVELDIKNPLISDNKYIIVDGREIDVQSLSKEDIKFLKEKGYDAVQYKAPDKAYSKYDETIIFDKSQIKSQKLLTEEVKPTEVKVTEDVKQRKSELQNELDEYNLKPLQLGMSDAEYKNVLDKREKRIAEINTELKSLEEVKPTKVEVDLKSPEKMNASQNRYGIIKEGKDAGFIVTGNPKDGVVKVQGVTVNEDLRGKGLAGEAYIKLGNDLAKEGISLASDSFDKMEPSAKRVWDKLVDRGLAEKGENNYELKKPEAKSVEQLRADEQTELDSKIPNAEQYRVNGKVDRVKLTNEEDIKAFDEVYNKYDKLISPLLEKPAEVKVTEEVIEKDDNGDFVPKKFTLNRAGENPAPNIPIESIKEESFGGEMPTDVKQVKLLEIRGRNAEGETVGSVSIEMNDGTRSVYEVKFNDEKLTSLEGGKTEAKPTESKTKEEYQKIKSNKKKKDFVRNNLPEEFKPLADELTEAQMSEIVDSNFDLKTIKNIQDAVQKQSAAEVLQPKQEEDGGAGGGRKRVEQGKQGNEPTGESKAKAAEEAQPKGTEEGKVKELKTNDKSILNRINSSENIPDSVKEKFKDDLKYEVKSKEEAKSIAKNIIKEYGTDDAVTLAEANKFHGDVNSFIFSEAINDTYIKESEAKTPEEKLKYAEQWADYAIRFDESARSKGRFISAISDFYKKSPLGIKFVENERRNEDFKKWYKAKEGSYKEVFDELVQDPKFKSLIGEEVQKGLKEERAAQRQVNRKKIEDFFENAKLKGNNLYAVPIPPKLINGALEIMKQSVLAGESVVNAVNKAIEHISKEVKDWDKEKFRKEYETKLSSIEGKAGKREKEELPEDAKNKILDKFRKKLKGLDESQKEQVIRKSFKQLVENGALEYNDFKKIIAETIGYGEVTPEEAAKITKLVNDINSVDDLAESIRNEGNRSEQNLLKYQKAKKEAEKSATELNKMVYNKTNISNRLLSIMQLNTLGIPSLINNPIFNIWNQATVRFPNAVSMTVLDQILYGGSKVSNKLFGTGVLLPENNVLASQKEFFKKALQGGKLSTEQLFTGLTNKDYFQKEIYSSQIHPFTSIKDLWNWKFNGKNLTPAQVADKSIQATVGLPAEIVARALNIGDKPQRFAAEGAQAAVFAKNLGLKDIDYKYFLEFPKEEAYRVFKKQGLSDDVAMKKAEEIQERIIKQGEESTFQQENLINEVINSAVNIASSYGAGAEGVVKVIKTLNMPYLKIPLNASWSVYNLANPQVAFLQSAIYGARAIKSRSASDIQQSKKWFAHGVTGIALTGIAGALVSNGIINASNRSDETSKKERQGEKTYEQQNSINVTKLNAYLRGENPNDVKNSLNVDLKWFGNVGNILNIQAIKDEEMTPEQRKNGMSFMEDMLSSMSISSMELIENGVFSNTSGLLTAIDKGGNFADSYALNLINMGTNIVQPAMFAQMSRAQLPYYSQQKADTFMEELKNNLLTRSSVLRSLSNKYPPSQIGVWGDRLDRKDNVAMKLFGISSNNNDNFAQPIYNDYKKTNNTAFLPPAVKPEVNGFELNVSQTNKLETLVGQARKNLVAPFVNDGAKLDGFKDKYYSKLSEEDKTKALGILYKEGYKVGEKQFTDLYPEFYKSDKKTPEQKKESKESSIFRKSLKKLIK